MEQRETGNSNIIWAIVGLIAAIGLIIAVDIYWTDIINFFRGVLRVIFVIIIVVAVLYALLQVLGDS